MISDHITWQSISLHSTPFHLSVSGRTGLKTKRHPTLVCHGSTAEIDACAQQHMRRNTNQCLQRRECGSVASIQSSNNTNYYYYAM
mmetsp:Transcript_16197/g.44884  ORF Transcript_16197/g.44884 Transcript_16197/m.44884 type:complete len:86 (+) Transcript_16197:1000-1257(+)